MGDNPELWGVPGTLLARRALDQHGYLDARSYLKTPRVFGFHGVYKRLATHLGIVNVHLKIGPNTESLVDSWARDLGLGGLEGAKPILSRWSKAVRLSLNEKPPRTKVGWDSKAWAELAEAFAPSTCKTREKLHLREQLLAADERRLGALPAIWQLQAEFSNDGFQEEELHNRLELIAPDYSPLLAAIRAYEGFARSLQDAFDVLKAEAAGQDAQGFAVPQIARDADFRQSVESLHKQFETTYRALGEITSVSLSLQNLFAQRFKIFAEPMAAGDCAIALCHQHEAVQRAKSAEGKRPWFDRLGSDRIYIRHAYRNPRPEIQPGRYVHDYRGKPIRRFHFDLS